MTEHKARYPISAGDLPEPGTHPGDRRHWCALCLYDGIRRGHVVHDKPTTLIGLDVAGKQT